MIFSLCWIYSEQSSTVASYCFVLKIHFHFHICKVFCSNLNIATVLDMALLRYQVP